MATAVHRFIPAPPPPLPPTAGSDAAAPLTEANMTLLQTLVQSTRSRRRVQPNFETLSWDGPSRLPHDPDYRIRVASWDAAFRPSDDPSRLQQQPQAEEEAAVGSVRGTEVGTAAGGYSDYPPPRSSASQLGAAGLHLPVGEAYDSVPHTSRQPPCGSGGDDGVGEAYPKAHGAGSSGQGTAPREEWQGRDPTTIHNQDKYPSPRTQYYDGPQSEPEARFTAPGDDTRDGDYDAPPQSSNHEAHGEPGHHDYSNGTATGHPHDPNTYPQERWSGGHRNGDAGGGNSHLPGPYPPHPWGPSDEQQGAVTSTPAPKQSAARPRDGKKKKHHKTPFVNRTTHSWISTNTTTTVILPSATVQVVPMPNYPATAMMMDGAYAAPVDGRWANSVSPYLLPGSGGASVPAYHPRPSQMVVLEDGEEAMLSRMYASGSLPPLQRGVMHGSASGNGHLYHSR